MDRETLMMIATIVAIAGVIFLFKEMNKAKQDLEGLKNFSSVLIQKMKLWILKKRRRNKHIRLL